MIQVKIESSTFDKMKRLVVKFLRFGLNDTQTAIDVAPAGTDSNPIKGMVALYDRAPGSGETYIVGYLTPNRLAAPGEYRTFSTDANGNLQAYIWLKGNGNIELGGNADNAVRFSKLEDGFNQLKSDFNAFLTHVHGGSGSPPTPPALPSTASISAAKITSVLTP